jgi:hypothetical protein
MLCAREKDAGELKMKLTTIVMGHAGVGKSPLNRLFRDEVLRIEPYRVREAPRGKDDSFYASQEVRDKLKLLSSRDIIEVINDIEIHPMVTFFKVRGSDQFLFTPIEPYGDRPYKVEIYAPVLLRLLEFDITREILPFLVGGKHNLVLILILNSCRKPLNNKLFKVSELEAKTELAVMCRHKLKGTPSEKAEKDAKKRIQSLHEELPAWKTLGTKSAPEFAVVDIDRWEYLEYTYLVHPVNDVKQLKPIPKRQLLAHQKTRLKAAKRKVLETVKKKVGAKWSDLLRRCLLSDNDIDVIDDVFVEY